MTMSPCVRVCKVDSSNTYCVACFRTLSEISSWQWMTEDEKALATALAETRKLAHKLDNAHEIKAASKTGRVEPCNGHDSQG
jgi:predicted Fe-S protein YdhL (DUF1289 family)